MRYVQLHQIAGDFMHKQSDAHCDACLPYCCWHSCLHASDGSHGVFLQIDADVIEAKGILKYMRRCCLLFLCSCCCECDPNAQRDATRKARVKQ